MLNGNTFGDFAFHVQSSYSLRVCVLVDARIFVCVNQLISHKLVMMVKVLCCNEASCVAPGYSSMLLGQGFANTLLPVGLLDSYLMTLSA